MNPKTRVCLLSFCLVLLATAGVLAIREKKSAPMPRAAVFDAYGRLPLAFEANQGQSRPEVKFISRNAGHTLFLTGNGAQLQLQGAILTLRFPGANRQPAINGGEALPGHSNYFLGQDPERWRTNVPNYARVEYDELYPGIDLVWHGNQRRLEHDFIVAPGASPGVIRMSLEGAASLRLDDAGDLIAKTGAGDVRLRRPEAWQKDANGNKESVACEYIIGRDGQIQYRFGKYDVTRELVIDPVLLYSSYLGGSGFEQATGIAIDKDGNIVVASLVDASDFPGPGPIQASIGAQSDVFVVKLNPSATAVLFGAWLGGRFTEEATALAVDMDGNVYAAGFTYSPDFPVTSAAVQKMLVSGNRDGFVAKINPSGTALLYATYLGGNGEDIANSLAVDQSGNAYIAGTTDSTNLPGNGYQPRRAGSALFKTVDQGANWTGSGADLLLTNVEALSIDPINSDTVYAGGLAGVFKSRDGGVLWNATGQGNANGAPGNISVITVDPVDPETLYIGARYTSIHKSVNGGNSYAEIAAGILSTGSVNIFYDILIDPSSRQTLYVGTNGGAFKSLNGGASWSPLQGLRLDPQSSYFTVYKFAIHPVNRSILYAATSQGVYKTIDGGGTWTAVNNGLELVPGGAQIQTLAIDPANPNTLYAGGSGPTSGVFKTTDGGATWRPTNGGLNFPGSTQAIPVTHLVIDPALSSTVYAGTLIGVYKSTNGGASWAVSTTGMPQQTVNALAMDPRRPDRLYAGASSGTDGFAAKLNPQGSALVWLSYLGGSKVDQVNDIAIDRAGNLYLTGSTFSFDFPVRNPMQATVAGGFDAFVAKLDPSGSELMYSTLYGGLGSEFPRGIAVNAAGEAYIAGTTTSANLPVKNAAQPALGGAADAFSAKLNAAGSSLEYATYLGGMGNDNAYAIVVDVAGNAYVTGDTASTNFPQAESSQSLFGGGLSDAFVTKLNSAGSAFVYSTFLGGNGSDSGLAITLDRTAIAYVTGSTRSSNFPLAAAYQSAFRGSGDAFLALLGAGSDLSLRKTVSRNPVQINNTVGFTLTATNNGPSPATGVVVTDVLPASFTFVSATTSQGTCTHSAGMVTCNLGAMPASSIATINLTLRPTAVGTLANTASIRANELDANEPNNQSTAQVTIATSPSIYGRVLLPNKTPAVNVTMNLSGAQTATLPLSPQGNYQFTELTSGGNYTVTPAGENYSFEPPSRTFNPLEMDTQADFTATPCTYSLSPTNQSFDAAGGNGTITVIAPPRCAWTATSSAQWIKVTAGQNGAGNGTVSFTVDPTTSPRAGRIAIGGQVFPIWQGVNACNNLKFRAQSYFGLRSPVALFSEDLDGDGLTDLIVSDRMPEIFPGQELGAIPLRIYYGEMNGRLKPGDRIFSQYLDRRLLIGAGDLNRDGRIDLALASGTGESVLLLINQGSRRYIEAGVVPFLTTTAGGVITDFRLTDLNKDGKPDLIGSAVSGVTIALKTSAGDTISFASASTILHQGQEFRALADLNNDGIVDLITSIRNHPGGDGMAVYLGDGQGRFRQPVVSLMQNSPAGVGSADFNGDGNPDLARFVYLDTPEGQRYRLAVTYGDGAGRLGPLIVYEPVLINPAGVGGTLVVRDINNDARPDVIVLTDRMIRAFLTDSSGKTGAVVEIGSIGQTVDPAMAFGHFDAGDGIDLATIDSVRSSVVLH